MLCSFVLPAVLAALPIGYELDYGVLPAKAGKNYTYTIVFSFKGQPDFSTECEVGTAKPAEVADIYAMTLANDPPWVWKKDGNRIAIYAYGKDRVTKIQVTGDGPKPLVRPVLFLPEKEMKK